MGLKPWFPNDDKVIWQSHSYSKHRRLQILSLSLSNNLTTQLEVDVFNKDNSHKTGKDLTIEYLQNDVKVLHYCMNEYVNLSMKEFGLNPLHYESLPGYRLDCWLMSSGVTLDNLWDKQMLDDFIEAKRVVYVV